MAPRFHLPAQDRILAAVKIALRDLLSSYRSFTLFSLALLAITIGATSSQAQTGCVPNTPNYPCVYVANQGTNSALAINASTNNVIATISVGASPVSVAITPNNASAYVVNNVANKEGSVEVIDTNTNTARLITGLSGIPVAVAITPDGKFAYVLEFMGPNKIAVIDIIDTNTNMIAESNINLAVLGDSGETDPKAIAFTPDGSFAYVADSCLLSGDYTACAEKVSTVMRQHTVTPIDVTTGHPDFSASIAVTPNGMVVCLSFVDFNDNLHVAFISPSLNMVVNSISILNNAVTSNYGFGITPAGILYAGVQQSTDGLVKYNSVVQIDTKTQSMLSTISVGNGPTGVAVGPSGAFVYVTNEADSTVSIINTSTLAVFTTQAAFNNPQGVTAMSESPPTISTQPASQTIGYGQSATLTVVATSPSPLSYQWYQGQSGDTSRPISGATSSSYPTPSLTLTTSYWVLVSNIAGSASSNTATIAVTQPFITSQPASQTIPAMQTATMSVTAIGVQPLSYQWYQGQSGNTSMPISGATSFSYTTPPLISTTSYWVLVRNSIQSTQSNTAVITTQASAPSCGPITLVETSPPPLVPTTSVQISVTCTDPQGEALTTTIDWDDGTTSSPPVLSHNYAAPGFYTLTVSAVNTSGLHSQPVQSDLNLNLMSVSLFAGQSANLIVSTGVAVQPSLMLQFTCTTVIDSNGIRHQASDLGITCKSNPSPFSQLPVTLVITTTGGASGSVASEFRRRSWLFALWLPVSSLVFVSAGVKVAGRRKHGLRYLGFGTAIVLLLLFVSCASGGFQAPQTSPPPSGTPPGTYGLTVIDEVAPPGNSSGFVQTTLIVQLTVEPFQ